jgi:HEPN domain-containing protein
MANQKQTTGSNTPREWRLLAEVDLSVAEHLATTMSPLPTAVIAFHCQQAAEKYLKGALYILGEEPPYTHDLVLLYNRSEKYRPSYISIFSSCSIITQFAVQPRYDLGLSLSDDDMRLVLAHTKIIREFLKKELPELFQDENEIKR